MEFLNKPETFGQNNEEQLALFQLYMTVLSDSLVKAGAAMHGMNWSLQGVYFTSLPFLAADKGVHVLASASGSRGYTSAGTSAKGEGNKLHIFSPLQKGQYVIPKQRIFCLQVPLPALHRFKVWKTKLRLYFNRRVRPVFYEQISWRNPKPSF